MAQFIIKNSGGTVAPTKPVVAGSDPLTGKDRGKVECASTLGTTHCGKAGYQCDK